MKTTRYFHELQGEHVTPTENDSSACIEARLPATVLESDSLRRNDGAPDFFVFGDLDLYHENFGTTASMTPLALLSTELFLEELVPPENVGTETNLEENIDRSQIDQITGVNLHDPLTDPAPTSSEKRHRPGEKVDRPAYIGVEEPHCFHKHQQMLDEYSEDSSALSRPTDYKFATCMHPIDSKDSVLMPMEEAMLAEIFTGSSRTWSQADTKLMEAFFRRLALSPGKENFEIDIENQQDLCPQVDQPSHWSRSQTTTATAVAEAELATRQSDDAGHAPGAWSTDEADQKLEISSVSPKLIRPNFTISHHRGGMGLLKPLESLSGVVQGSSPDHLNSPANKIVANLTLNKSRRSTDEKRLNTRSSMGLEAARELSIRDNDFTMLQDFAFADRSSMVNIVNENDLVPTEETPGGRTKIDHSCHLDEHLLDKTVFRNSMEKLRMHQLMSLQGLLENERTITPVHVVRICVWFVGMCAGLMIFCGYLR